MKNTIALSSILALALGAFLVQSPALAGRAVNAKGTGVVYHTKVNPNLPGPPFVIDDSKPTIDGWTTQIHRNHKGVTINVRAVGLNPHHAYTAWIAEIGTPGKAQFLTGHIVGGTGESTFSGRLGLKNPYLMNPLGSEFHIVIADHGMKDPSTLPDSIKTAANSIWTHAVVFEP